MTDGRVFTLDDEIDTIHEDLGRARRRLESLERAEFDGRVADRDAWRLELARTTERVQALELELREACAQQVAAAEGFRS
ncbi:MAG: hypothetical protein IT386_07080 [Deltaproteobacteria bacterium]|nr:hypothetical protein [Deltaproteobacteria bacterium]